MKRACAVRRVAVAASVLWIATMSGACSDSDGDTEKPPEPPPSGEALSGGDTTVFDTTSNAFGYSARNMTSERRNDFFVGNSFVRLNWVTAPASVQGRDGLGPLFNARSCSTCHLRDGRGSPPDGAGEPAVALLFRLSIPGQAPNGGPLPEPMYGGQLQPIAIPGVLPEARPVVSFAERRGAFADGEPYVLLEPHVEFADLSYGPMQAQTMTSPRLAPAMIGLGLLELIPEADIAALADPDDTNGDGISGRPNHVWDERAQAPALGRFGWKANQPTVLQQVAGAFHGDIGITSGIFPSEDCSAGEAECNAAPSGGAPELSELILHQVTFYSQTLAVPARRDWNDPAVLRGKALFSGAGCGSCHVARFHTAESGELPELSSQTIYPYTDLLLHDMGPDLADGRPDFEATGSEWKTPPLWGLGLFRIVNGNARLLHDGRARDALEAILWHGGEAEKSRESVLTMSKAERADLLHFLESL